MGSSPVQGGKGCLCSCHGDAYSRTQHVTSDASPPLSLLLPATCLQVSVSAAWAAHVKCRVNPVTRALLAKTSHSVALPSLNSNSITSPRSLFLFEKKMDIHRQPAVSSQGPGFTRLLLMYSLRSDLCGSARIFGEVPKYFWLLNHHYLWHYGPQGFFYPLTFSDTYRWLSCFVRMLFFVSYTYVECCGRGHLASLTAREQLHHSHGYLWEIPTLVCIMLCLWFYCAVLNLKSG